MGSCASSRSTRLRVSDAAELRGAEPPRGQEEPPRERWAPKEGGRRRAAPHLWDSLVWLDCRIMERMESMEPISACYTTSYPEIQPDSGYGSRETPENQAKTPPAPAYNEELEHKVWSSDCVWTAGKPEARAQTSQLRSCGRESWAALSVVLMLIPDPRPGSLRITFAHKQGWSVSWELVWRWTWSSYNCSNYNHKDMFFLQPNPPNKKRKSIYHFFNIKAFISFHLPSCWFLTSERKLPPGITEMSLWIRTQSCRNIFSDGAVRAQSLPFSVSV